MRTIKKLSAMIMVFLFLISFIPMPMSIAKAAEISDTVYVKIRYVRPDADYTDWNVWVWQTGKDGSQVNFIGKCLKMLVHLTL